MSAISRFTRLAGASVLSMAAMATAVQAADRTPEEADAWQLSETKSISDQMAWAEYPLMNAVIQAKGGDKTGVYSAAGFAHELSEAAENPSPRPRKVFSPNPEKMHVGEKNFVIGGILPPNSRVDTIPVCIEQNNEIKATFQITALGKVEPVQWNGPTHSTEPGKFACTAYFNQRVRDLGYLPSQQQPVATAAAKTNSLAAAP